MIEELYRATTKMETLLRHVTAQGYRIPLREVSWLLGQAQMEWSALGGLDARRFHSGMGTYFFGGVAANDGQESG